MKLIFFGIRSIGKRHIRIIQDNSNHKIYAFRSGKGKPNNDLGIEEVYTWKDVEDIKPDVAFITNPTFLHVSTAINCANLGMNLFIEKPLSNDEKNLDELKNIITLKNLTTYVAYCLRFHPVIKWLKDYTEENKAVHATINCSSYMPEWRKGINHLEHYSANKEQGGGVILELSHEIDYLNYLFGDIEKIKVLSKRASNVTKNAEDFADILVKTKKDIFCNLHINFLSRLNRREIIIDFEDHTVIGDLIKNNIQIIRNKDIENIDFDIERDDIYRKQLAYFFKNIENKEIMNNLEEAIPLFKKIMQIKEGVAL